MVSIISTLHLNELRNNFAIPLFLLKEKQNEMVEKSKNSCHLPNRRHDPLKRNQAFAKQPVRTN